MNRQKRRLDTDAEFLLNIEDLTPTGVAKLHALYAHAGGWPLDLDVTFDYPTPVFVGTYRLSDVKVGWVGER